jgi:Tfp pilus assembly protein FimT
MLRNRKGVTLIEIMTVVVMVIIMTAVAFPKLKETRRAASMQSARTQVESYLAVARSVAIRNGVRSFLIRDGNTIRIMADSANGLVTVVAPFRLDEVSQILLSTTSGRTADTIIYDNRGIAVNLASSGKIYLTVDSNAYGAGIKDSICVTRLGLVMDKKCGLSAMAMEKKEDEEILIDPDIILDPKEGPIVVGPIVVDPSIIVK